MNERTCIRPHARRGFIGSWWLLGKRHDTGRPVEWREEREVEGENRVGGYDLNTPQTHIKFSRNK